MRYVGEWEPFIERIAVLSPEENARAAIQKIKDNSDRACACNPETLKMCLWHFDFDAWLLVDAIRQAKKGNVDNT